ncbi:hypothetical protein [Lentzea sp. NPDC003310]|uniref:hypothetical protein n=1 Tax=Lentzea sp. NPDC003310 TaxID=3154447 RepID=UPI0033BC9E48
MTATTASRARISWPEIVSWLLAAVLVPATLYGLLSDRAYRLDQTLRLESVAQDVLTLAIVPVLVLAGRRARAGSAAAHLLWLGLLAYVAYTYLIYAFGVPQNSAFLLYVAAVALSVAALVDGVARVEVRQLRLGDHAGAGWFLIAIGLAFAGLWLSDLLPSLGGLPGTIGVGELPYPVYVVDLAFALPAITATGVALVRRHPAAPVLAAVVLVKIVTLGLAIEAMAITLLLNGLSPDWPVAALFLVIVVVCTAALVRGTRRLAAPTPGWLRPTLWT